MSSYDHPSMRGHGVKVGVPVFDWAYQPQGPYIVQFFPEEPHSEPIVETWSNLEDAIRRFFEIGVPARYGWYGNIIDAQDRLVLAWMLGTDCIRKHGPDGLFAGVGEVFAIMMREAIPNFVDPQIWADQAMGNVW